MHDGGCSEFVLAAAHGIGRLPPGGIVFGPGHVAGRITAAFVAEALFLIARALCIFEGAFEGTHRKGSAGEFVASPPLRVVVGERDEAVVLLSAEILVPPRSLASFDVLVESVVCALEELVFFVVCRPGEMTGRAHGIIAVVEAVSRPSNHDVVRGIRASVVPSFIGVVNGPPEVRELGVVLAAGS